MITLLRKHHRWLMIIIVILSIPFVFYFVQQPDYGEIFRSSNLGTIYDRTISQVEYTRNARLLNLASGLGLSLPNDLMTTNVRTENDMYVEFTWNRMVLRHETERLGIRPSEAEIADYVKTISRFRGDSGFDMAKYTEFTKEVLPAMGFNESQIEEVVSDQLSVNRIRDLLGTGVQIPESENKENYEKAFGKMHVSVVRLQSEDFKKDINIGEDEIAKYFEANKDKLKSEEKRKVEFVSFTLTEGEKGLVGKEKTEVLQKMADKTNDFTQALLEKDAKFDQVAARFEAKIVASADFTAAEPPKEFEANPSLTQYAFQLTDKNPVSDAIQGPDGFHVLRLLGITEAKPLTLEEARPKIVETMTNERLQQLMSSKGAEIAQQLREGLKSGAPLDKSIAQTRLKLSAWWPTDLSAKLGFNRATEASNLKLERVPPFSLIDSGVVPEPELEPKYETADLPAIKNVLSNLEPGEVSEFNPVEKGGGFIAAFEKRDPADPAGYPVAKAKYEAGNLTSRRKAVFIEWMRDRRKAAKVVGPVASTGATG